MEPQRGQRVPRGSKNRPGSYSHWNQGLNTKSNQQQQCDARLTQKKRTNYKAKPSKTAHKPDKCTGIHPRALDHPELGHQVPAHAPTLHHYTWLFSASADVMMGHVCGARSVAVLVVRSVCAGSVRV